MQGRSSWLSFAWTDDSLPEALIPHALPICVFGKRSEFCSFILNTLSAHSAIAFTSTPRRSHTRTQPGSGKPNVSSSFSCSHFRSRVGPGPSTLSPPPPPGSGSSSRLGAAPSPCLRAPPRDGLGELGDPLSSPGRVPRVPRCTLPAELGAGCWVSGEAAGAHKARGRGRRVRSVSAV